MSKPDLIHIELSKLSISRLNMRHGRKAPDVADILPSIREKGTQLVNYRVRDNVYIVDRLFARAELRMGERRQDVVRIWRTDLGGPGK